MGWALPRISVEGSGYFADREPARAPARGAGA
jgi:hypothetical protein